MDVISDESTSAVHEIQSLVKSAMKGVVSMVKTGESNRKALRIKQKAAKQLKRHKLSHTSNLTSPTKNLTGTQKVRKLGEREKPKKMPTIRRHTLRR